MTEDRNSVRALGAFSGGLDGMVAACVLLKQDISVSAITFDSPFFNVEAGRKAAAELGIPWRAVDFTQDILNLLDNPPSGFGKNMNPCIDCHAAMFIRLKDIALKESFDFIFSGEVLGQRPMSQNRGSLNRVKNISSTSHILLRPLSAKLLEPTPMEISGLVHRELLLDINGRGRSRQIELAEEFGFSYIPAPAGGCLLTDPGYSRKLRVLKQKGLLNKKHAEAIQYGRMFIIGSAIGIAGRSKGENAVLQRGNFGAAVDLLDVPSPFGVLLGDDSQENLLKLASIMASYTKGDAPFTAVTDHGQFTVWKIDENEREELSVKL